MRCRRLLRDVECDGYANVGSAFCRIGWKPGALSTALRGAYFVPQLLGAARLESDSRRDPTRGTSERTPARERQAERGGDFNEPALPRP
jgi:hypothetical protein